MSKPNAADLMWVVKVETIIELTQLEESDKEPIEFLPIVVNRLKLFGYTDENIECIINEYFDKYIN